MLQINSYAKEKQSDTENKLVVTKEAGWEGDSLGLWD